MVLPLTFLLAACASLAERPLQAPSAPPPAPAVQATFDPTLAASILDLASVPDVDIEALLTLHTPTEVETRHLELIEFIFGRPTPPHLSLSLETEPPSRRMQAFLAPWKDFQMEFLTLKMDYGLVSNMILLYAGGENTSLLLYHTGHGNLLPGDQENVIQFLEAGYDVLFISMPLTGLNQPAVGANPPAIAETECCGRIEFTSGIEGHTQLEALSQPLKYFFEPIAAALDHAEGEGYRDFAMVGVSGGGWAALVYAAIDARITASFPVAASLPLWMRLPEYEPGDFEQRYPPFYQLAGYLDLYLMGAYGKGRSQLQIFNYFDPCCYGGERALVYLQPIQTRLASLGSGAFDIYIDRSHNAHMISPEAVAIILAALTGE